jgi:hypothetical protein
MACPYFFPVARHDAELWPFRRRLPLGDGFMGRCTAPNSSGSPSDDRLGQCCNLGYANDCPHLPPERHADAVHFCVGGDRDGVVQVSWLFVKNHAEAGHGSLEFDRSTGEWRSPHPDPTLQQMAECYLRSYLSKRGSSLTAG